MSRHGKNCRAKARRNARLKKAWLKRFGNPTSRRWNAPPASSILIQRKKFYELYGNAHLKLKGRRK